MKPNNLDTGFEEYTFENDLETGIPTAHDIKNHKVLKDFSSSPYYGPMSADFATRIGNICIAAKRVAYMTQSSVTEKLKSITSIHNNFINALKSEPFPHLDLTKPRPDKKQLSAIKARYKSLRQKLIECVHQFALEIADSTDKNLIKCILKEIYQQENQLIANRPRPTISHRYSVTLNDTTLSFISHQEPVNLTPKDLTHQDLSPSSFSQNHNRLGTTTPSTIRDQEGLPNFLKTRFSVIKNGQSITLFEGYRHSSYPPIYIRDKAKRDAIAQQNVRQIVLTAAASHLRSNHYTFDQESGKKTINLNLSSLSLLTNSGIESLRGCYNENQQIHESYHALGNHLKTFSTEIDGETVTINVDIDFNTIGSNPMRNVPLINPFRKKTESKLLRITLNKHIMEIERFISTLDKNDERKTILRTLIEDFNFLSSKYRLNKKQYQRDKYFYQLQARYLISAYMIGRTPDFFCKSGEDRTGRVNNVIEELLVYYAFNGQLPDIKSKDTERQINENISPIVHTYSTSRETTHYNAYGARGFQMLKNQGSDHLEPIIHDKVIASTAKTPYKFNQQIFKQLTSKISHKTPRIHHSPYFEAPLLSPIALINAAHSLDLSQHTKHLQTIMTLIGSVKNNEDRDQLKKALSHDHLDTSHIHPTLLAVKYANDIYQALRKKKKAIQKKVDDKINPQYHKPLLTLIHKSLLKFQQKTTHRNLMYFDTIEAWASEPHAPHLTNRIKKLAPKRWSLMFRPPFIRRITIRANNLSNEIKKLNQHHTTSKQSENNNEPSVLLRQIETFFDDKTLQEIRNFKPSLSYWSLREQILHAKTLDELDALHYHVQSTDRSIRNAIKRLVNKNQRLNQRISNFTETTNILRTELDPDATPLSFEALLTPRQKNRLKDANFFTHQSSLQSYSNTQTMSYRDTQTILDIISCRHKQLQRSTEPTSKETRSQTTQNHKPLSTLGLLFNLSPSDPEEPSNKNIGVTPS